MIRARMAREERLTGDRSAYFRAYQRERRARLRELRDAEDRRCAASDCDNPLAGKRRGTRFCSNPCWQRERYRRSRFHDGGGGNGSTAAPGPPLAVGAARPRGEATPHRAG